ncbi:MAG: energy transducer TonB [Prevotella sp.]|nr:energy transducer TonB [Prevotella sp.]
MSVDPQLSAEALRIVRNMPKWKPATKDGKAVVCEYNLPVNFKLQ